MVDLEAPSPQVLATAGPQSESITALVVRVRALDRDCAHEIYSSIEKMLLHRIVLVFSCSVGSKLRAIGVKFEWRECCRLEVAIHFRPNKGVFKHFAIELQYLYILYSIECETLSIQTGYQKTQTTLEGNSPVQESESVFVSTLKVSTVRNANH